MVRKVVPFKVCAGQEIYLQPTGNNSRHWDGVARKGEVVSVKRKYFYVVIRGSRFCSPEIKFSLQDFTSEDMDLNSGYLAYPSQEAFEEAQETERLIAEIRDALGYGLGRFDNISVSAAKEIYNILAAEGVILKEGIE